MLAPLGEFEQMVLFAVLRLAGSAHPPSVRAEIESRGQRRVARGAVYVTLDRLESKRLLTSKLVEVPGVPSRPRRAYALSPKGLRALRESVASAERMRSGLEPLLRTP